jgi:hypothetical protein
MDESHIFVGPVENPPPEMALRSPTTQCGRRTVVLPRGDEGSVFHVELGRTGSPACQAPLTADTPFRSHGRLTSGQPPIAHSSGKKQKPAQGLADGFKWSGLVRVSARVPGRYVLLPRPEFEQFWNKTRKVNRWGFSAAFSRRLI